jgi:xanthine dehydrogenase accessory factor
MERGGDRQVLNELMAAIEAGNPVVLATVVATRRSVPRHAGTKMLVRSDGTTVGTVGGGAMESRVIAAAVETLGAGTARLVEYELVAPDRGDPGVCGGEVQVYLEPYMPAHTVFVIGAGHVGAAVAQLAHWMGYRTIVTDDRPDRLEAEALPDVDDVVVGPIAEVLAAHDITDQMSVVLVSRDVEIDVAALTSLLDSPARYIGVMGSSRRWKIVRDRLVSAGISEERLERVHVPVGLDLGAETVEEIAVAILGQIIAVNRGSRRDESS